MRKTIATLTAGCAVGLLPAGTLPTSAVDVGWGDETSNPDGSRRVSVEVRSSTAPRPTRQPTRERGSGGSVGGTGYALDGATDVGTRPETIQEKKARLRRHFPVPIEFEDTPRSSRFGQGFTLLVPGPVLDPVATPSPVPSASPASTPTPTSSTPPDLEPLLSRALVALDLPAPDLHVGPDPASNAWGMVPVGYPLWVWTSVPQAKSARVSLGGVTLTLDARPEGLHVDPGPGTPFECAETTPYTANVPPAQPSPTCGFSYASAPTSGVARLEGQRRWRLEYRTDDGRRGIRATSTSAHLLVPVGTVHSVLRPGENS